MYNLNWADYVILLIFLLAFLGGLSRGFIKEFISLITLIAAFIISTMFASPLANAFATSPTMQNAVSKTSAAIGMNATQTVSYFALGLSFVLIFIAVIIVGAIMSSILNIAVSVGVLGLGNRIFGGAFGLVKGFIITLVLIFLLQLTPVATQSWWVQSQIITAYQPAVQWLGNIISPTLSHLKDKFNQTLQNVNSAMQNATKLNQSTMTTNAESVDVINTQ